MSENSALDERFVSLLVANQGRVYRFLMTLVPRREDAEDLLQQTSLTLWQHRAKYDPAAGEFASWACAIAHNHVRNFRRRENTRQNLLSEEVADLLVETGSRHAGFLEDCHRALLTCMERLTPHQRTVVEESYSEGRIVHVARAAGRTPNALYKALRHIRGVLHECIRKTVGEGGFAS